MMVRYIDSPPVGAGAAGGGTGGVTIMLGTDAVCDAGGEDTDKLDCVVEDDSKFSMLTSRISVDVVVLAEEGDDGVVTMDPEAGSTIPFELISDRIRIVEVAPADDEVAWSVA
jgi:hypothetical protein